MKDKGEEASRAVQRRILGGEARGEIGGGKMEGG